MCDIVLLEDDELIRMVLADALRDAGFEVREAADGEAALLILGEPAGCKTLITDIDLGQERNGLAVARAAMQRHPLLRVIYCTGRPDTLAGHKLGPRERGLIKPFQPAYLVEVVQGVM